MVATIVRHTEQHTEEVLQMSSEPIQKPIGSTIVAAEVAASEDEWEKAEAALLTALSEVRKRKSGGSDA